jgi:glutamate synthase (NADPH/NADH) large chain
MAQLGLRSFDELIGRADLLETKKGIDHWKARGLDFSRIFYQPPMPAEVARRVTETQDHGLTKALDHKLIEQCRPALEKGERVSFITPIRNINRTVGTMLSSTVARKFGHAGLPDDTIHIQLNGTAGQSFGAFLAHGITLDLVGDANDYTGKGLSGGRVIVRCPNDFRGAGTENIIVGNTVLYGAIAGQAYFNGVAGERFAVRNSGATAVVEGTGDHGCEYMTKGTVVVLGATGRNFAAGMSGGIAYVFDEFGDFASKCNQAMCDLESVLPSAEQQVRVDEAFWHLGETDEFLLRGLVESHFRHTGSLRARMLLDNWAGMRTRFVKVFPHEYRRAEAVERNPAGPSRAVAAWSPANSAVLARGGPVLCRSPCEYAATIRRDSLRHSAQPASPFTPNRRYSHWCSTCARRLHCGLPICTTGFRACCSACRWPCCCGTCARRRRTCVLRSRQQRCCLPCRGSCRG